MAQARWGDRAFLAALLVTGTSLALYGQVVTNARATDPKSQVIALTKYLVNFIISAGIEVVTHLTHHHDHPVGTMAKDAPLGWFAGRQPAWKHAAWQKANALAVAMGLLEVVAYALNCLGFPLCGSALSMVVFAACGQIFTALARTVLLRKGLNQRQQAAVAVVIVGLVLRSKPHTLLQPSSSSTAAPWLSADLLVGSGYIVASAACYSLLGVLYEFLFRIDHIHDVMTHSQVNLSMSLIGVVAMSGYQWLYTWPRREQLVLGPMSQAGMSTWDVVVLLAGFGWLFTMHTYVQGQVLEREGAMAVGLVNSLRAVTVTLASAALFCSPTAPQQCLSFAALASAAVTTAGVMLWAYAPAPPPGLAKTSHDEVHVPKED